MRLDERLALLLVLGPIAVALATGAAGFQVVFMLCLLLVLVTRTMAAPLAAGGTRERLDILVALGVAGFALILVERVRVILGL